MGIEQSLKVIELDHYRMMARTKLSKEGKRGLGECEIGRIFRAKHENKVELQQSEKLPVKKKCQSSFT